MTMQACGSGGFLFLGSRHAQPHRSGETPSVGGRKSSATCLHMTAELTEGLAMSKRIALTQGRFAIVNDADFEWLNQWKWHCAKGKWTAYAVRGVRGTTILMHRIIMETPLGMQTDHINSNGLDNRRCNLRICTPAQNQHNYRKPKHGHSSRYKGVTYCKGRRKPWQAQINIDGKRTWLGRYASERDAAQAYDVAARLHYREFARLNFAEKVR